jgi:hypothetical protein
MENRGKTVLFLGLLELLACPERTVLLGQQGRSFLGRMERTGQTALSPARQGLRGHRVLRETLGLKARWGRRGSKERPVKKARWDSLAQQETRAHKDFPERQERRVARAPLGYPVKMESPVKTALFRGLWVLLALRVPMEHRGRKEHKAYQVFQAQRATQEKTALFLALLVLLVPKVFKEIPEHRAPRECLGHPVLTVKMEKIVLCQGRRVRLARRVYKESRDSKARLALTAPKERKAHRVFLGRRTPRAMS